MEAGPDFPTVSATTLLSCAYGRRASASSRATRRRRAHRARASLRRSSHVFGAGVSRDRASAPRPLSAAPPAPAPAIAPRKHRTRARPSHAGRSAFTLAPTLDGADGERAAASDRRRPPRGHHVQTTTRRSAPRTRSSSARTSGCASPQRDLRRERRRALGGLDAWREQGSAPLASRQEVLPNLRSTSSKARDAAGQPRGRYPDGGVGRVLERLHNGFAAHEDW